MRITQVELTNIKSYRHAVIPLHGGTTAIRGRNGAGKSTLVEAIGFALFDALAYKQAQFVREGERVGNVVVSFFSAFDDREYQVVRRCGGQSDWYAFDPMLGARIAEQKADVLAFLRQHLRIEGEVALDALFNDAIGVPQGTFTQDFLMTPALRKKKFDALLQVEDYRKAADRLLDTRAHIQDHQRETQRRIDDLERETGQLAPWRAQRDELATRARELAGELERIEREARQVGARRQALQAQEAEVARLTAAAQVAEARRGAVEARAQEAERRAEEAREAVRTCQATRPDHETYGRTERTLAEARERARTRDGLVAQRAEAAQRHEGAKADLSHTQRCLEEARAAERQVAALAAAVKRQTELESQRDAAEREAGRLTEIQREFDRLRADAAQAESDSAEAGRKIAALEELRGAADALPTRRERLERLQVARAARAEQEKRLAAVRAEQTRATSTREKLAAAEAKAAENVRRLLAQRETAERLPALEAEHATCDTEVRRLEAQLAHSRASREQSGVGHCPFLREPCLNIQRRGENSLAAFFDRQIAEEERRLVPARERLEAALAAVEHARKVRLYYDRLGEYQEQQRQHAEMRQVHDDQLARLADERAQLERSLADGPTPQALDEARVHLNASQEAERRRGALPELRAGLARAEARRQALDRDLTATERHIAPLRGAPAKLDAASAALGQLGDPKRESAAQERIAAERGPREAAARTAATTAATIQAELAKLDQALRPFAGLDESLRHLEAELERTREGHTRYLRHEHLAARMGELEATLTTARRERDTATKAHAASAAAHQAAAANFDADELARTRAREQELGASRGATTEALKRTQEEAARLAEEIIRVERLLETLAAARAELGELEELERMLQHFRETIKEAGPHILKALLRAISAEANHIFGEILGDRSAQLSWEQDYEILLRRDGRERSFAQLSGGEQMSAALAVRLALLRALTRLDIAFFDEPTQNMDGERRGNLAEQIRRVRGFDQLIVISHDDTFEQGLDSVIHLDKRGGETVLVEDEMLTVA